MQYLIGKFTFHAYETPFISIIGDQLPARRVSISYSYRDALDDLIGYLNMMMAETVLTCDATEDQVRDAYDEHLAQPVEIVVVEV